jgi:hypothetical protein
MSRDVKKDNDSILCAKLCIAEKPAETLRLASAS